MPVSRLKPASYFAFDTLLETLRHQSDVRAALSEMRADLDRRGFLHDRTKLEELEFWTFTRTRPKFREAEYGSEEYRQCTEEARPAVEHHYAHNRHHVAFHEDGFAGMNLLDILEMLADWKAAAVRSPGLGLRDSLPRAYEKYGIPENMQRHIEATLEYLGWLED